MENEKKYWQTFELTGSIEDYLIYKGFEDNSIKMNEDGSGLS